MIFILNHLPPVIVIVLAQKYLCFIFKASALWADAFYKSICPSVRLYVCTSVHFWGTV